MRPTALYAVALVFFGIVLWRTRVWDITDSLSNLNLIVLAAVPMFSVLPGLPLAIRQRSILSALGYRFSAWTLLPITFYGNSAGFITPASSGEILRPALFQRALDIPLATGAAVVLYERLYSYVIFLMVGSLALLWVSPWSNLSKLLGSLLLLLAAILPPILYRLARWMAAHFPWARELRRLVSPTLRRRFGNTLHEGVDVLGQLMLSPRLTIVFCLMSCVVFLIMALQFWFLVDQVDPSISFGEAWAALMVSNAAGVVSGLPFGLGAADAVMVSLLKAYGADDATAATSVLLLRGLIHLPTGIMGTLAYLTALRQGRPQLPQPVPALLRE